MPPYHFETFYHSFDVGRSYTYVFEVFVNRCRIDIFEVRHLVFNRLHALIFKMISNFFEFRDLWDTGSLRPPEESIKASGVPNECVS